MVSGNQCAQVWPDEALVPDNSACVVVGHWSFLSLLYLSEHADEICDSNKLKQHFWTLAPVKSYVKDLPCIHSFNTHNNPVS